MSFDFTMIDEDNFIYVKKSKGKLVILSLYIDDILLAGNNLEYVKIVNSWLSKSFDIKDMGEANYILGVKIQRDCSKNFLSLSQEIYTKEILERFQMNTRGETLSLEMCPKSEK
uniref:Reverse transcriptase Ty1/copia-type domain-containing protein n=1 Tax=Solanum lycopersicum TaxID=4081 RepID=A0A3Q7GJF3_SOLLC